MYNLIVKDYDGNVIVDANYNFISDAIYAFNTYFGRCHVDLIDKGSLEILCASNCNVMTCNVFKNIGKNPIA